MCGFDYFDFDGYGDPDDDFQEDMFEEEFEPELDELEMEAEMEDQATPEPEAPESGLDFQEIFVIGGMIAGQAYEEAMDKKEQQDKKDDDDSGDPI